MTKQQTMMIAMAGAALVAATQAQAQFQYNNEDLLLNVRDVSNPTTYSDLTIDLGNVTTLTSLPGTTVLDTDAGAATGTWSTTAGYTPVFSAGDMEGNLGGGWKSTKTTGFTVTGANAGGNANNGLGPNTVFLATPTGTTQSAGTAFQQISAQGSLANVLGSIGTQAAAGTSASSPGIDDYYLGNSPATDVLTSHEVSTYSSATGSFQEEGQQSPSVPGIINFGSLVGQAVETQISAGGATEYATLYDIPQTGQAETELGYFSFYGDGEITYTEQNEIPTAVPEPSTYGLLAGLGLLAVSLRRQFRLLHA
jgi:hypothetical protein